MGAAQVARGAAHMVDSVLRAAALCLVVRAVRRDAPHVLPRRRYQRRQAHGHAETVRIACAVGTNVFLLLRAKSSANGLLRRFRALQAPSIITRLACGAASAADPKKLQGELRRRTCGLIHYALLPVSLPDAADVTDLHTSSNGEQAEAEREPATTSMRQ